MWLVSGGHQSKLLAGSGAEAGLCPGPQAGLEVVLLVQQWPSSLGHVWATVAALTRSPDTP